MLLETLVDDRRTTLLAEADTARLARLALRRRRNRPAPDPPLPPPAPREKSVWVG